MIECTITKTKQKQLDERMKKFGIREEDIVEKFILGSGKGGQKINKTSSCVYLRHMPTGIEVKCQISRSRAINRFLARRILCEKIEEVINAKKRKARQEREKIRRRNKRRTPIQKETILKEKKQKSAKKVLRKKPERED